CNGAHVAGLLRDDEGGVRVGGVEREGVAELAGQAGGDLGPGVAAVVGAVDAAVVLLVQPVRHGGVQPQPVHALPGLGQGLRQEVGARAAVGGRPGRAAVVGAVDAAGGDGRVDAVGRARVHGDRVQG